jgi:hypothetical protein
MLRIPVTIAVLALMLASCGSDGGDVPSDQPVKPLSATPSGWDTTDLDAVTVATPPEWTKLETQQLSKTLESTTWRSAALPDGTSASGAEVRVISTPQQSAKRAARALAIDATAQLQGGSIEPVKVTWPDAKSAYFLSYTAKTGKPGEEKSFATRTLVLDLEDGRQVQVTALSGDPATTKVPAQVLGTVTVTTGS